MTATPPSLDQTLDLAPRAGGLGDDALAAPRTLAPAARPSFGSVLRDNGGFGPGFDFMRLILAVTIVAWHSVLLGYGTLAPAQATPFWSVDYFIVPMFFALSGFLVAGSGMRLSLDNFLLNRAARILPALAAVVLFSACVIGPALTTLPLHAYFTHPAFRAYLPTMVGVIGTELPGLFTHNPVGQVNFSLWSVPYEMGCYAMLAVLITLGFLRDRRRMVLATAALMLAAVAMQASGLREHSPMLVHKFLSFTLLDGKAKVFPCFLIGVVIYQWRDFVPFDRRLFLLALGVCLLIALFGSVRVLEATWLHLVGLPALAYTVLYLGLSRLPKLPIYRHGDYSYGIYLAHMPLLQSIITLVPGIQPLALFALGLPVVTCAAALSWHLLENPVLTWRRRASRRSRQPVIA